MNVFHRFFLHKKLPKVYFCINNYKNEKMNFKDLHIGSRIQQVLKEQGRNVSWFAKQICYERSNVYKLFKRKSIDTDLLIKISEVLGHDFLSEYFGDGRRSR